MSMSYCPTAEKSKKCSIADFFSIIAFMLIILIFFFLFKFTTGKSIFKIDAESSNVEDSISLINILKTEVEYENSKISIAELISASQLDKNKFSFLEKELVKIIDKIFGALECHLLCINGGKIKSSGCRSLEVYRCPGNTIIIPGYNTEPIEISFQSNIEPLKSKEAPLK